MGAQGQWGLRPDGGSSMVGAQGWRELRAGEAQGQWGLRPGGSTGTSGLQMPFSSLSMAASPLP